MNSQNLDDAGSYKYGQFYKNEKELDRLKLQARIALDLEKKVWEQSGLRSGMKVLDLACGPGIISCELAKVVGAEGSVIGVDINEELISVAHQARDSEQVENVSFTLGNLYALELPENTFDFVYARFVFQHLEKPESALANVMRVLKPGGTLCIVDVEDNWTSFSPESNAFVKFIRKAGAGQKRKGGNRLIGSQLFGMLRKAGYQNVSTQIHTISSEDIGVRYFLGVAVLFRVEMLNKLQKLLAINELRKIKKAAQDEHAWGSVGIFASIGTKK
ncbi:MAG: methyltransferase domain-containing protein [Pontiellaceae bacterium]|nr:methyltransferase domain-containing protein [Pontiellaceae bacterium]